MFSGWEGRTSRRLNSEEVGGGFTLVDVSVWVFLKSPIVLVLAFCFFFRVTTYP